MSFFRSFKKGMENFSKNISTLVNFVLLSFVYVIGVGVTKIFAKIKKKHFLDMSKKDSYWNELNLGKRPKEEYYRQF